MTNYGAIPTSTASGASPSTSIEYLSRAKDRIKSGLATRRPWKVMLDLHSLRLPSGFSDAVARLRANAAYFRTNYAVVILGVLFLSLLWHPISLIVFLVMMAAWLFLYFLRDEPLVVFRRAIDDRVVLVVLSVLTLVFLFLTHATENVLIALLVGVVLVVLHAALRKTEDLYVDEEAAASGGLLTSVGAGASSSG